MHRPKNQGEGTRLGGEEVFLQRPAAPGVNAAEAHLDEVGVDPGRATGAVVLMGLGLELEGVDMGVEVLQAERQGRGREGSRGGELQAVAGRIEDAEPTETGVGAVLL